MTISEITEKLSALKMEEEVTVTDVLYIKAPDFSNIGDDALKADPHVNELLEKIPVPYFKVLFTIKSSPSSEVHAEILLPETGWNSSLVHAGNGGLGNAFAERYLLPHMYDKSVVVHGDLGTAGGTDAGVNNASVWSDFGWRATHLITVAAKKIIELIYGIQPKHSYFIGTSTGGQQGVSAASYFPEDFDGVLAKLPGISRAFLHVYFAWTLKHLSREDGGIKFSMEEIDGIGRVVKACMKEKYRHGTPEDADVMVEQYFSDEDIEDVLVALKAELNFSEDQLDSLRKIYQGPVNPRTGERIFPGFPMGAEARGFMGFKFYLNEMMVKIVSLYPLAWGLGVPTAELDVKSFDFDKDVDRLLALARETNADNSDLSRFRARGGKIIITSGVEDAIVPAENVTAYYERIAEKNGGIDKTKEFCRYYIIPGVSHTGKQNCSGTEWVSPKQDAITEEAYFGETVFSGMFDSLVRWVECGEAPDEMYATEFNGYEVSANFFTNYYNGVKSQRPIYPYPEVSVYESGDPNDPHSYKRVMGELGRYRARAERYWI